MDLGDINSLKEKMMGLSFDSSKIKNKIENGSFDFNDMLIQLNNLSKMGGIKIVMSMIPKSSRFANHTNTKLKRNISIIQSMTKIERSKPEVINQSRKIRISKGAGVQIEDVDRLIDSLRKIRLASINN